MVGVWLVLAWLDTALRNPTALMGIVSLELTFSASRFADIVASWDVDAQRAAWWSLGLDFGFMWTYARFLALCCRWVGLHLSQTSSIVGRWSQGMARAAWAAAVFDLLENAGLMWGLWRLSAEGPADGSLGAVVVGASVCAAIKFVLVIVVVTYALNGAFAHWMGRLGASR